MRDEADRVFEVPGFLDGDAIVAAATRWNAGLLHPGYGFLSESASFAAAVEATGIAFVGPTAESMRRLGDKEAARRTAVAAGVPVLPSLGVDELAAEPDPAAGAERAGVGFPCAVKAAAGGGGIGIRVVRHPEALAEALSAAASEARAAFGDGRVYVERWLDRPRHVEIQVLGDGRGAGIHLGERECSVQRRRQKLLEWAPGFGISPALRTRMGEAALRLVIASRYRGAGTVEFLLGEDGTFHFLEVNTRLQVEHPITEEIYGVDLVDAQLEIAGGSWPEALPAPASRAESFEPLTPCGAAFEARIVAESPRQGFAPSPGRLRRYREPEGEGVRVDSGVVEGSPVPPGFDSLLAKVIASGGSHAAAAARLASALEDTVIHGVETNASLMISVLRHPDLLGERVHAGWLEGRIEEVAASRLGPEVMALLEREGVADAVAAAAARRRTTGGAEVFLSLGHGGAVSAGGAGAAYGGGGAFGSPRPGRGRRRSADRHRHPAHRRPRAGGHGGGRDPGAAALRGRGKGRSRTGLRGGSGPPRRPGHPHPRRREQRRGRGRGRRDRVHEDALGDPRAGGRDTGRHRRESRRRRRRRRAAAAG